MHLAERDPRSPAHRVVMEAPRVPGLRRTYRFGGGTARCVADVMTWPAVVVQADSRAADAAELAAGQEVHHLPVTYDGYLVGIVCLCDLDDVDAVTPVARLMTRHVMTVPLTASLFEASALVLSRRVGCLPVTAQGHVCGVVTLGDLVRAGILDEEERRHCLACGGHHHVRGRDGDLTFCIDCLRRGRPAVDDDPYEELGAGD